MRAERPAVYLNRISGKNKGTSLLTYCDSVSPTSFRETSSLLRLSEQEMLLWGGSRWLGSNDSMTAPSSGITRAGDRNPSISHGRYLQKRQNTWRKTSVFSMWKHRFVSVHKNTSLVFWLISYVVIRTGGGWADVTVFVKRSQRLRLPRADSRDTDSELPHAQCDDWLLSVFTRSGEDAASEWMDWMTALSFA